MELGDKSEAKRHANGYYEFAHTYGTIHRGSMVHGDILSAAARAILQEGE